MEDKIEKHCGLCGKEEKDTDGLIQGKDASICFSCVDISKEIVDDMIQNKKIEKLNQDDINFTPKSLIEYLDQHVVGQEAAKKELAVAIYNHFKRLKLNDNTIHKSNGLIIGPSGSGKTLLVEIIAKFLKVPYYIGDATSLTESGFQGEDVLGILTSLYLNSDSDIDKAQRGIIFVDEIDKIAISKGMNNKDISGKSVQEEFLKIIEGGDFYIPTSHGKKNMESKIKFNTDNVLFIFSGAFEDIYSIIEKRINTKSGIGFGSSLSSDKINDENKYNLLSNLENKDILEYGFVKEFIGRISFLTHVNKLSKEDIKKIIIEPKNSIFSSFKKLLMVDKIELDIEDDAIDYIANKAYELNQGARALKNIMENALKDIMFEAPEYHKQGISKVVVTKNYLEKKSELVLVKDLSQEVKKIKP